MQPYDEEAFRQSMRRLASTVSVVACENNGGRFGITVTSAVSLSFHPLSVLVCIKQTASLAAPLLEKGAYSINVLRRSQVDISKNFSGSRSGEHRFSEGEWAEDDNKTPYLRDAQANLFCRYDQGIEYSTHLIIIGRIEKTLFDERIEPLIYQDGGYASSIPMIGSAA